jgi:outer membrane immunogenic protein
MRCVAIVGAGLLSITGLMGAASAADLPAATYAKAPTIVDPVYNWTGFYIGIEGGGNWGQSQHYFNDPGVRASIGLPLTSGIKANGGLVGGTFGYNYQFSDHIVIGFENDLSWTNSKGTAGYIAPFPLTNTAETSQSWLYTVRGRLGYAWDRWLVFGTGGVAFTDENMQLCSVASGCADQSRIAAGWTAGGGVEYAFAGNWSAKLEYLHADFGSQYFARTPSSTGGFFNAHNITLTEDIVRAGLSYKFGWDGTPLPAGRPAAAYAQMPAAGDPAYNWTGFYLGIEGGGDWSRSQLTYNDPAGAPAVGLPMTGGIKANGALAGGTFGYNYQLGNNVVIGFENDMSWTNSKGTAGLAAPFFPVTDTSETSQSWLYTGRGRVGYGWNRWLVFGTGGVAFTNERMQLCGVVAGCGSQSQTVAGWTAGGGVEYAFAGNWSAKLEYLHNDFGSQAFGRTPTLQNYIYFARNVTLTDDIVRAGVNYKFGWDGPVAKY